MITESELGVVYFLATALNFITLIIARMRNWPIQFKRIASMASFNAQTSLKTNHRNRQPPQHQTVQRKRVALGLVGRIAFILVRTKLIMHFS